MKFSSNKVKILEQGGSYIGSYIFDDSSVEVKLHFHQQGRVRLMVLVNDNLAEDIELRMPTTQSMNPKMQATALIMSAIDRHR